MIEADFTSHYHLTLADQMGRSARWLMVHIRGLLTADTRISRALRKE